MAAKSENVTFKGASGVALAARLDLPAQTPRAYAVFAHCFTCSKDIFAAARISSALAARGFAVLRFDFTGLGKSEGEFANTDFSSNVADLIAACDWLRGNHQAPSVLIGHSLGGAAVLAAAGKIAEARAVATIGAPADTEHVTANFAADLEKIEAEGKAEVTLGGRKFTITRDFLEDVQSHNLEPAIASMKKALLVFHGPRDEIVGIDNASRIFTAAKHPKSFVTLDDADHLLTRKADAIYVADVLAAWAERYLDAPEEAADRPDLSAPDDGVLISETGAGKFQQNVVARAHRLLADEPESFGGLDTGPTPYDFLSIALGACTSMTLRIYAEHKKIALDHVAVTVTHDKLHAKDCEECGESQDGKEGKIDRFERRIAITGNLDDTTRKRLLEIADKCPVHKTLEAQAAIVTKFAE